MRFTKLLITCWLLFFFILDLRAQDPLKPVLSSNSSSLLNLNAHDINLFTGTPNISVPLYSHTVDNYTIDVGLRYSSAGGVRVSELGGNVGLGWHLTGGGSIIRKVRGYPDEMRISNMTYNFSSMTEFPFRYGYFHNAPYGNINWNPLDWQNIANNTTNNISLYNNVLKPLFGENIQYAGQENLYYKLQYGQIMDTEPDIFEFNFNGKSGQFIFNNQNGNITVHQVPWQGLKISYTLAHSVPCCQVSIDNDHDQLPDYQKQQNSPVIISFIVTDTDNTKYYFEAYDHISHNYKMNSVTYRPENGLSDGYQAPMMYFDSTYTWKSYAGSDRELYDMDNGNYYDDGPYSPAGNYLHTSEVYKYYTSSWQLTKVVTPNGKEIKYNYSIRTIKQKIPNLQEKNRFLTYQDATNVGLTLLDVIENKYFHIHENYLTSVTSDDFKMTFSAGNVNGHPSIPQVKVFHGSDLIKRFDLQYSVSISEDSHFVAEEIKREYYRPILTELREYDHLGESFKTHKFSYNLAFFGGQSDQKLPHTYSFSVDQWGFYNGADNENFIPRLYIYPDISLDNRRFRVDSIRNYSGRVFMMDGSDRSSHGEYMTIGMLNKITYPTGGSVTYEFEPNTYLDEGQSSIGPGVRIKRILSNFGTQQEEISYSYTDDSGQTSGRVVAKPVLARILSHIRDNPVNDLAYYALNLSRYGDTQAELSTVDSRLLGYNQVTEFRSGQGKTVYTFSNQGILGQNDDYREEEDDGDGNLSVYGGCIEANCDGFFWRPKVEHVTFYVHNQYRPRFTLNPASYDTYPFAPAPNYDWNRGHLLDKVVYDAQGRKVQHVKNTYQNVTPTVRTMFFQIPFQIKGLKVGQMVIGRPNDNPMLHGSSESKGLTLRAASYVMLTDIAKVLSSTTTTTYYTESGTVTTESVSYEYRKRILHRQPK